MAKEIERANWPALWSSRKNCGYHAKGWCARFKENCKKGIKQSKGSCFTSPEDVPPNVQATVEHLRTLEPSRVRYALTIGAA